MNRVDLGFNPDGYLARRTGCCSRTHRRTPTQPRPFFIGKNWATRHIDGKNTQVTSSTVGIMVRDAERRIVRPFALQTGLVNGDEEPPEA